jgi:transposase
MQAASGNTNDNEGFKQIVKHHLSSMKAAQNNRYFIGDAALYVAETIIQSLHQQGQLFISRAPQNLKAVRQAISEQHSLSFDLLENGYSGAWLKMNYGDVEQRWLLVRSEQAKKSEQKTLNKKWSKSPRLPASHSRN